MTDLQGRNLVETGRAATGKAGIFEREIIRLTGILKKGQVAM